MAQIEKYTLRQAQNIIAHVERTGATHSNKNIDMTRTAQNYAVWPLNAPDKLVLDTGVEGQSSGRYAWARLMKRLSEVSCLQRKDVNVMCSWVVHLGVDVPPGYENERAFFTAAAKVMADRYGHENVLYAWVHRDETASHLHFGFVPVVEKPLKLRKNAGKAKRAEYEQAVKNGLGVIERVDANVLVNKSHLKGWHGWFKTQMTEALGYDSGVYTKVTRALGGNTTVKDLKQTPADWREQRNAKVAEFHEARRANNVNAQPIVNFPNGAPPPLDDVIRDAIARSEKQKAEWLSKHRGRRR